MWLEDHGVQCPTCSSPPPPSMFEELDAPYDEVPPANLFFRCFGPLLLILWLASRPSIVHDDSIVTGRRNQAVVREAYWYVGRCLRGVCGKLHAGKSAFMSSCMLAWWLLISGMLKMWKCVPCEDVKTDPGSLDVHAFGLSVFVWSCFQPYAIVFDRMGAGCCGFEDRLYAHQRKMQTTSKPTSNFGSFAKTQDMEHVHGIIPYASFCEQQSNDDFRSCAWIGVT